VTRSRLEWRANSRGSAGPSFSQTPSVGTRSVCQTSEPHPRQAIVIFTPRLHDGSGDLPDSGVGQGIQNEVGGDR
jgi:hypothetical protein